MVLWSVFSDRRQRSVPSDLLPSLSPSASLFISLRRNDRYVSCARSRRRWENSYAVPHGEKLLTSRRAHGRARGRRYRPGIADIEESKRIDPDEAFSGSRSESHAYGGSIFRLRSFFASRLKSKLRDGAAWVARGWESIFQKYLLCC